MAQHSTYSVICVAPERWDALVQQFDDRTVFHAMPWLSALETTHNVKPILAAVMRDDECMAVWPCMQLRKGVLRVLGSPLPGWSTAYMGPLFKPDADRNVVLAAFMKFKLFRRHSYFACKVLDQNQKIDLSDLGFSVVMRYDTYRLDLNRSEDQLWKNLRRECRNHVRKAQKAGVVIEPERCPDFIDEYWDMSVETFAKANMRPTHSRKCIVEMWKHLHPAGQLHALSAFHDGQRVATAVLLCDHNAMYYWGGASFLRYRHLSAHNLLQWEGICHARRQGLPVYDFISTTGGPGKFKQSFGPERVHMTTHWERSPSRLMSAVKHWYELYLRRRQRLSHGASVSITEPKSSPRAKPITLPASAR